MRHFQLSSHLTKTRKAIMQNLFWASLGKFVSMLSGLLVGILVARLLGPRQYGLMNYVISYVFLFQTFATFGMDAIEIREEAAGRYPFQTILGTAFSIKCGLGLLSILASIALSWYMDADVYTTLLVAIYSLTIVLNSGSVIRNYFTAIVQNEYVVKAEISRSIIGMVIKLVLLLLKAPLEWFVAAYAFDWVLLSGGYYVAYKKKIGAVGEWRFDRDCATYLLKESFPLMLTNAAVIVYQRIDQVMIGKMIDKESLGYFSVASRFVEVLIYLPMMLAQTITPVLVRSYREDRAKYQSQGQLFMNASLWLSVLLSLTVACLSYPLIRYTFGTTYLPSVIILQVLCFKAASVALSNTAGAMIITEGIQKYALFRDALGCAVCILLNLLLLPVYGVLAAAFVAIASNIVAGYVADAFIPSYRHIFTRQNRAILFGWRDVFNVKKLLSYN